MRGNASRAVLGSLLAVTVGVATAGAAFAVSGGGYSSGQQGCPVNADAQGTPHGVVYSGCHNGAINVADGNGNRYVEAGLNQLPSGGPPGTPGLLSLGVPGNDNSPHAGCIAINTNGTGGGGAGGCGNNPKGLGLTMNFDYYEFYCLIVAGAGKPCQTQPIGTTLLTPHLGTPDLGALLTNISQSGLLTYLGADDNLDAGEHDGVDLGGGQTCSSQTCTDPTTNPNLEAGSFNGPSDGGASQLSVQPQHATTTPTLTNLVPLLGLAFGACADGVCVETATRQQTVYQGCSPAVDQAKDVKCSPGKETSARNVANYAGKQFDPPNCSSGDLTSESPGPNGCGPNGMDSFRQQEAHNVNAQPGLTLYEDPDAEGSPIGPYPLPAVYVGSCGVILGGGQATVPATPLTNSAGQLVLSTGC